MLLSSKSSFGASDEPETVREFAEVLGKQELDDASQLTPSDLIGSELIDKSNRLGQALEIVVRKFARLDRYERRAVSRREAAIPEFDALISGPAARTTSVCAPAPR